MIRELRSKTSEYFGMTKMEKNGEKQKKTSPHTVELGNEVQIQDKPA